MILSIADSINSLLQAIMFIIIPNYCMNNKYKKNNTQLLLDVIILWVAIQIVTVAVGNTSLGMLLIHISQMFLIALFFNKNILTSIISFSMVYLSIGINYLIFSNLFFIYIQGKCPEEYLMYGMIICVYMPQIIMGVFILRNKDFMYRLYQFVRSKNFSIVSLVIITLAVDFIAIFRIIIYDVDNPLFKEIVFVLLSIFIIYLTLYFATIEKKAKEIAMLNNALEEKVNELKKVKHDYGAQISYLYGMHLMEKYDRLGELLKDIINGHNNIIPEVKVSNDEDSIINMIMNGIEHKGINVIIDEQASLELVDMSEMELQRVISNIINNSVTAMKNKGIITIKTYYDFNNVVIKIQNNGPKIDDNIIERIFEVGFSTKEDKEKNHGLGLAIVKEIVESYKGTISVISNTSLTEFIIKLPKIK